MKEYSFLLDEPELQNEKTVAYKAPQVIVIFLVAVLVASLDAFFLGIGLTMALFKSFKWLTLCVFLIKLIVDIAVFATWYFLVKEKTDKANFTTVISTENSLVVFWKTLDENGFLKFKKADTTIRVKGGLLRKFYGVYTVQLISGQTKYSCNFLVENKEKVEQMLLKDK